MRMKRIAYLLLLSLLLVSCGTRSGYFKMEGRFLHMNQGQLYVYSPDGGISGLDTIRIEAGRFAYEIPCSQPATLVVIFPNYSTQPIFAEPGEAVEVKADASHLKEMEVEGTDDNELMTDFRKQIASVSPPEELKYAIQFIKDHPESVVSPYLLNHYLVQTESPDYRQAAQLLPPLLKEQPGNGMLARLSRQLKELGTLSVGSKLPGFSAKDVNGKPVSKATLSGQTVIISTWATWSYESLDLQRALSNAVKKGKIAALGICVDANAKEARQTLERDAIAFPNICDGKMLGTPLLRTFGLTTIPDNIVIRNGKVTERGITANTIRQRYGAD
ncbi:MAG: AhpC/TSA family protein [Prevotella sp.]|nr:AhpC/TSA family protein [Prevotella sp.]